MISQRTSGLYHLIVLVQCLLISIFYWSLVTTFYLYHTTFSLEGYRTYAVPYLFAMIGLLAAAAMRTDALASLFRKDISAIHRESFRQIRYVMLFLFAYFLTANPPLLGLKFVVGFFFVSYLILLLTHWRLPAVITKYAFSGARVERTLIVGTPEKVSELGLYLAHKEEIGIKTIGIVCDDIPRGTYGKYRALGELADLRGLLKMHNITQVIVAEFPIFKNQLQYLTDICQSQGVRLLVVNTLPSMFIHKVSMFADDGLNFIGLREEPMENPYHRLLKRALDLAVAIPVVFLLLPITSLIVAIIQATQAPGPLFYIQTRAGLQNRTFRCLKYRTMYASNHDAGVQAKVNDSRIYPAARWLRRLSIDELPQFINVLLNEMSVVGPRPHLVEHNDKFANITQNYHIRAFIKPGITGMAQIRGYRGEISCESDLENRIKSDLYYIEKWSFNLDLLIILRTFMTVIIPPTTAR
jgi:putative colanic acid biosynthesis UDP-glucose lipid carrier transferase